MKRQDLVKWLESHQCVLSREGKKHSVFVNNTSGKSSTVPRHNEINDYLARKICRDLQIQEPRKK